MATIIDSLVVELGLDPSKFTAGQRAALASFKQTQEQATSSAKIIEAQGKKTTEFFTELKRGALELLGVFLGGRGIKEFVTYITNVDAATGRYAKTLGMTTEQLSAWRYAAEQTGGTAEGITGTLQGLTNEMNTFMLTGQSRNLPILRQLGVNIFDVNNQLKTAGQLMLDIIDATEGMESRRRGTVLSMLGFDQATINAILTMGPAYKELIALEERHAHVSEKDAAAAIERQKHFAALEQSARDLGQAIVTYLTPTIDFVADAFTRLFNSFRADEVIGAYERVTGKPPPKPGGEPGTMQNVLDRLLFGSPAGSMDKYAAAIGAIESSGRYTTVGKQTRTGDRAYGKYGVMGENIRKWTEETLGFPMTPQQFLLSPTAQDAVFNKKFGELVARYGPQSAASVWFTGKTLEQGGATRIDPTSGMTGNEYVDKFNRLLRHQRPGIGAAAPIPYLGSTMFGAPAAAATQSNFGNRFGDTNTHTSEVNVGTIQVSSSKADAKDVAMEIPSAIKRTNWAASANYSLSG